MQGPPVGMRESAASRQVHCWQEIGSLVLHIDQGNVMLERPPDKLRHGQIVPSADPEGSNAHLLRQSYRHQFRCFLFDHGYNLYKCYTHVNPKDENSCFFLEGCIKE